MANCNQSMKRVYQGLVAVAAFGIAAGYPATASAQRFELRTTYKEGPGTREIESGKPEDAIKVARVFLPHSSGLQKVTVLTNLCVGYIMVGDLEAAEPYCDAAAERPNERTVTHNNRGVLRALKGDIESAKSDFSVAAYPVGVRQRDNVTRADRNLPSHAARRNLQVAGNSVADDETESPSHQLTARGNR